jgi:hypothetical protein
MEPRHYSVFLSFTSSSSLFALCSLLIISAFVVTDAFLVIDIYIPVTLILFHFIKLAVEGLLSSTHDNLEVSSFTPS